LPLKEEKYLKKMLLKHCIGLALSISVAFFFTDDISRMRSNEYNLVKFFLLLLAALLTCVATTLAVDKVTEKILDFAKTKEKVPLFKSQSEAELFAIAIYLVLALILVAIAVW
jgi:hypothetical protein